MKVALPVAAGTAVLVAVVVLVSRSNGARASTGGDTPSWLDEQAASFDRVAALVVKEHNPSIAERQAAAMASDAGKQLAAQNPRRMLREHDPSIVEERPGRVPVPCGGKRQRRCCGDGHCNGPETPVSCPSDCPGVMTDAKCGEEPHSDTGGIAVVFGINHRTASAQECCDRCRTHAANPSHKKKCNSWVFCPLPICWGLDTGWNHTFGECWLKFQPDPTHPLYGQRGRYTDEYRRKHRFVRTGPPTHVPWTGGVLGGVYNPAIAWTTGIEGMRSSKGEELTNWRAWEPAGSYETRLAKRRRGQINR